MQIDKRSRAELKLYFIRNAIPSESNFAELIDAMLSQREDGIAKLPNDALSIEAAGDDASQKRAIQFYNSFSDAKPTWAISLNPRQDPANPVTAKAGFSVSDANGTSRLFIEKDTGNVGLGTNDPKKRLHVQGASTGPLLNDVYDRPAVAITGHYPELVLFSNVDNSNHGPTIRLGSFTDDSATAFKQWVIGTAGRDAKFLDIGFSDQNNPNPHAGIRNYNGKTILTFTETGRVGIGTTNPDARLHVVDGVRISPTDTAAATDYMLEVYNPARGGTQFVVNAAGGVGIGTGSPTAKLDVIGGIQIRGGWELFRLIGDGMATIAFYPVGKDAGRKGWLGYPQDTADSSRLWVGNDAGPIILRGAGAGVIISKTGGSTGSLFVQGDVTVASGGNGVLWTPQIYGKTAGADDYGPLHLNYRCGQPVAIGDSGIPSSLHVYGPVYFRYPEGYWAFQPDGNLVKYNNAGSVLWSSGAGW